MTINKLTLAAVLTIGLMAGTMNSGIASNIDISNLDMSKLAACPLSDCQSDVTPNTATCPCMPEPTCNTCAPVDPCNPCECVPVVQSVCSSQLDGKYAQKQHYAYPANVYSDSQAVGSEANNVIIGEGSSCGCPLNPTPGVMVSDLPTCGCGCGEGITTGAAADMPVFGPNFNLDNLITGGAASINNTGCPIEMQTSSGMEVIKRSIVPYNPPITGGASPITNTSTYSFDDVPAGFWAGCDINTLAENKVIAGYPDRTFKPNLPVSRAEIASMAVNGFNLRGCGCAKKTFKDVPADHWANQAINTAVSNGLMEGYPGDLFKPNKPVSRAEAMVTLAKGIPCEMDNCKAEEILNKFCDGSKVPSWAKIPVAKAIESGALKDAPNGNEIQACKDASRADVASMLESVRVAMGYSKKDVAYTTTPDCGCSTGAAAFMAKDEVITIPTICLKFEDEISAKHSNIGDRFAAKTTESVVINGQTFPEGSVVYGTVTEVNRPTGNCKGGLKLSFERIQCHDCKADLPQQVLTAQVKTDKKPNFFAKVIEAPFSWAGSIVGTVGRTVGGAVIAAGNAVEHVSDGVGLTFGETLQGQLPAAGRSLMDATKALVKAPIDLTRTALSGTIGLLQTTGDEVAYLVDPKGNRVTSVNPRESVTVAFGCNNSCTGCAAPVDPCNTCDPCNEPAPCDCNNDCGCGK